MKALAALAFLPHPQGVVLKIRAAPGASRERIVGVHGDALKVAVQAPPEKGKANAALCRVLARALGVPVGAVRVVHGESARDKRVLVVGVDKQAVLDRLGNLS